MDKDFEQWTMQKKKLHKHKPPFYKEAQLWWCSIGANIGYEQDGKGDYFVRPVLILRKFNHRLFVGVSLSTKTNDYLKRNPDYYYQFTFNDVKQSALLLQIRAFDACRLRDKMGELPQNEFLDIKYAVQRAIAPL